MAPTDAAPPAVADVAVVVATRDRPQGLAALLAEVEGAREVIVVDDGSSPPAVVSPGVRLLRNPTPRGPAAARNTGWRAATAGRIAFTDDDCVPRRGWATHLAAACGGDDQFVQGRVVPSGEAGPFDRTLAVEGLGPWFQTANVLYPRALLEALGGFDERFPHPAGEDTDLAWRALELGARAAWAPEAVVEHEVHRLGPLEAARRAGRWSSGVRNVRRHPGLRRHLHHRVFWKREHEALLLASIALAAAPRTRGLSLALALPYLRARSGRHLPAHLLVDAAEMLAMARGSVSARTLLL